MKADTKYLLSALGFLLLMILIAFLFFPMEIRAHEINIYNETTEVTEVRTETFRITSGISDDDLAKGIATAAASGSIQYDFATFDWQGAIGAAWYEDQDAVTFGVGKRWEKINALFSASYTQNGNADLFTLSGTFRF